MKFFKKLLPFLLSIISGTLVFLAYPNFNLFPLAYIALIPLLFAIHNTSAKKAFLLGLISGTITNMGGFYWIQPMLMDFGHMSAPVAFPLYLLLCFTQGLVFACWTLTIKIIKYPVYITAIPAFVSFELLIPMVFPWYMANSQTLFIPATQIADITGPLGITAMIITVNVLLYQILIAIIKKFQKQTHTLPTKFFIFATSFILFTFIYGFLRIAYIDNIQNNAPKIHIGMVEANIGIWEKEDPAKLQNNLITHHTLSKQLADLNVDLIVWPESSYQAPFTWGSQLNSNDLLELQADALYTPNFKKQILPALRLLNVAFNSHFNNINQLNKIFHNAIEQAAIANNYNPTNQSYPYHCENSTQDFLKCPFKRIPPINATFFYQSPENIRPSRIDDWKNTIKPFDELAIQRYFKTPILLGSIATDSKTLNTNIPYKELIKLPLKERNLYNITLLLDKNGLALGTYKKVYLMPFGEFMPFGEYFPQLYDLIPESAAFTPGIQPEILTLNNTKIGMLICYEDILPRFTRKLSKLEPHFFVNATNDAWFGKTSEPYLHMFLATMRSIEHRKWLVRSTNTGVSVFVDAVGRIVKETSLENPEILHAHVPIMTLPPTIYSRIGDLFAYLCVLLTLCTLLFPILKNKIRK